MSTNNIPKLYSEAERRLLPIRERIMDAIYESGTDDLTVVEVLGLLDTIKFEIMMIETESL